MRPIFALQTGWDTESNWSPRSGPTNDGLVEAHVHPTLVPKQHVLASVNGVFNALMVRGDLVGDTLFYGRGAGQDPTTSSVISDLAQAAIWYDSGGKAFGFTPHGLYGKCLPIERGLFGILSAIVGDRCTRGSRAGCKHPWIASDRNLVGNPARGTRGRCCASGSDDPRCTVRSNADGRSAHPKSRLRQGAAKVVVGSLMNESRSAKGATIGVIERYREYLPVMETTPVVSLSEGSTPFIYSPRLSSIVGRGCRVYLKHEGLNPTGSFKDRGMTVAVSKAIEVGANLVVCASTGNTSASAAAYAARAGIRCAVLLPARNIAMGKLAQAFVYGAVVIALDGNFDQCLKLVRELSTEPGISVVNSINPYRLEGQKTAAFEIVDALGDAPHLHLLPVGNAGNTTAYWRGYVEYHRLNRATRPSANARISSRRRCANLLRPHHRTSRNRCLRDSDRKSSQLETGKCGI